MNKKRAALRHLWPSVIVLAIIACVVLFVWYPYPFLQFKANDKFSLTLITAAIFIGPALTWYLYREGKWGLVFDLVVVVLIQIAAISWATFALYQNRPYFMVFTVDRFEVLSIRDVEFSHSSQLEFLDKPAIGPVLLYANMPVEPQAFQKLLKEIMFEGKPDLQFRPEFWSFYTEKQLQTLGVSKPLSDLRGTQLESASLIDQLVEKHGGNIAKLNFVPGLNRDSHFTAILDADSGEVVDMLMINGWLDEARP